MPLTTRIAAALLALTAISGLAVADDGTHLELFEGSPFGVGVIRTSRLARQPSDVTFHVEAPEGQLFYPAYFRETLPGTPDPNQVTARGAYFLFKGNAPLNVRFCDGTTTTSLEKTPAADAAAHRRLLERWWSQYQSGATRSGALPLVENYTVPMLARRLGLQLATTGTTSRSWNENELLGAFLGFEELRLAMQTDRMLDDREGEEPADQPLPTPTLPPAIEVPDVAEVEIEALAARVPEECFYVRFGSYGNYLWFRDTLTTWGGNLREIVATRSLDYDISGRLERQLVLKDSDLGKLLGDAAISDMAVIGADPFVREGASIGVLFCEQQPGILAVAIRAQRAAAVAAGGVTEETLDIDGKSVSLLTSPGNVVRSYYVVDGPIHFVTTSSALVRRFLETGRGVRPLSELREFRYARTKHPIAAGNPVLIYLSDPFIRQLVSPAYRVEMTRRMRAEADVELVALARLAAIGEGSPHASLDELVDGGFLPPKFGKRADETLPLVVGDQVVDSLRGARRSFLPVADVLVASVTKSEVDAYQRFAQAYQALYRRMDPVSVSLTREPAADGREKIVLDLSITPFTRQNLGAMAGWLAPPSRDAISAGPEVLALVEAGLQSRLFAGVVDRAAPFRMQHGQVLLDEQTQARPPVFIGEHQQAFRSLLNLPRVNQADGYFTTDNSRRERESAPFGLNAGREWDDWFAMAFSADTLKAATPHLALRQAPRPAQLRLTIGDLGGSQAAPLLRAQQYLLEREASRVNAKLLDSFTGQLNIGDNQALEAASRVLGARVVCPLGGDYRRDPPDFQFSTHQPWYSTAWPAAADVWNQRPFFERLSLSHLHEPPSSYSPRLLNWVKGLVVEVQFENQTMQSRVELTVSRDP